MSRHTATPDVARELDHIWYETDVRGVLPLVQAPALLVARTMYARKIEVAEHVASLMPAATVAPVPGNFGLEEIGPVVEVLERFLGVEREPELDTVLATVLFTDLVGSTQRQASLGDRAWEEPRRASPRGRSGCAGAMAGGRERHRRRRLLCDLRRAGAGDPLRARDRPASAGPAGARSPCRRPCRGNASWSRARRQG